MKIANAHGITTEELAVEWGTAVTPEAIKAALDADEDIKAVSVVHNETSTGVAAPIEAIGKVMKDYDALYIVDTVSSLGGDYVDVDKFRNRCMYYRIPKMYCSTTWNGCYYIK